MDAILRESQAKKQEAAQDFVRRVVVSAFKQNIDEETIKGIAQRVVRELDASPADK